MNKLMNMKIKRVYYFDIIHSFIIVFSENFWMMIMTVNCIVLIFCDKILDFI